VTFEAYHTALAEPPSYPSVSRWENDGHLALTADIIAGLPSEVLSCDAIYGEPPWRDGYRIFADRAGVELSLSWGDWIRRYCHMMLESELPACAMFGKQGLRYVDAETVRPIKLSAHGDYPVFLAEWNGIDTGDTDSTNEVSSFLGMIYDTVADLCCGFGASSRLIKAAGGRFVAVDFNANCIGYIAAHAEGW
jgi:hypothetical protein